METIRETHPDAYLSLILGIVGLIAWPFGIFALTRGYKAKREIESTGQNGLGMAQAGVTLGWVDTCIGVIGLLLIVAM